MLREQRLKRVLRDCYCRLQPSKIHGIGVFAVRDIPKGRNPFRTLPKYDSVGYVRITEDELDALPPKLSQFMRALFVPTDGKMYFPNHGMNIIRLNCYLNHSTKPNMRTRDGYDFITRRKIMVGEELTVDYRTYGAAKLISRRSAVQKRKRPDDRPARACPRRPRSGIKGPTETAAGGR